MRRTRYDVIGVVTHAPSDEPLCRCVMLTPRTDEHPFETKLRRTRRGIAQGCRVRVELRVRRSGIAELNRVRELETRFRSTLEAEGYGTW